MLRAKIFLVTTFIITLAGCGQMSLVSRNANSLSFAASAPPLQEDYMLEQAQTLDKLTKELVRSTTLKGAAVGAATGCGLALVSGSEAAQCLSGALTGGALGAAIGNAAGRKKVEQRAEIVSLSRVTPALSQAQKQMAQMNDGLAEFIETQNTQIAQLTTQRDNGTISQAEYNDGMRSVREVRADLAQALMMSAQQARTAKEALKNADQQGQTGLDWHIMSADTLEDEAISARSRISLL